MSYFRSIMARLVGDETGQTAIEYGLVVALIAIVVVLAVAALFGPGSAIMNDISGAVTGAF